MFSGIRRAVILSLPRTGSTTSFVPRPLRLMSSSSLPILMTSVFTRTLLARAKRAERRTASCLLSPTTAGCPRKGAALLSTLLLSGLVKEEFYDRSELYQLNHWEDCPRDFFPRLVECFHVVLKTVESALKDLVQEGLATNGKADCLGLTSRCEPVRC